MYLSVMSFGALDPNVWRRLYMLLADETAIPSAISPDNYHLCSKHTPYAWTNLIMVHENTC